MAERTGSQQTKRRPLRANVQVLDRRENLLATETQMRLARWIAIPFVIVQFLLYHHPPGTKVPFPQIPVGLGVALIVLGINVVSLSARKLENVRKLARIGDAELLADTLVAMGVVFLFSFDPSSS